MLHPLIAFTLGFAALVLATWSIWFIVQVARYVIDRASDWTLSAAQLLGFIFGFPAHLLRVLRKRSRRSRRITHRSRAFSLYRPPSSVLSETTPAWYTEKARAQARDDHELRHLLRQANERRIS